MSTATANAELQFVRPCGHEGGPGADAPGLINGRNIGELYAADWGLCYDVATNLKRVAEGAATCKMWHEELDGQE